MHVSWSIKPSIRPAYNTVRNNRHLRTALCAISITADLADEVISDDGITARNNVFTIKK
jgi:hypothetical protein